MIAAGQPNGAILSRRGFMIGSGAFTVAVTFGPAEEVLADPAGEAFMPNAWVTIGSDDIVTIYFALAEMGQGIMTTLPLLVAEEMDADWGRVRVLQSPSDVKTYGTNGVLGTFGSASTQTNFDRLRLVGAQTRKILLLNAAERWKLPVGELSTVPGKVVHAKSGQTMRYGALAQTAHVPDPLPEITKADLKPAANFRYIGKALPRIDIPGKVNGSAVFGIDTQLPDMLYGAVLRPPAPGEKPDAIDDRAARAVAGVIKIVPLPYGVGVIAETFEATQKARAALTVQWSTGSRTRFYSSDAVIEDYSTAARDTAQQGAAMLAEGDAPAAIASAAQKLSALYLSDHVAHLTMEPMNATALVNGGTIEIWAANQSPSNIQSGVSKLAGVAPEAVVVHSTLLGGGLGRRYESDFAIDAFLLASETEGRPVKVIATREDDVHNDPYRPLVAQQIEVGLDAAGNIVGWRHRIVGDSYIARLSPARMEKLGGKDPVVAGGGQFKYPVPAHLVEYVRQDRGVPVGAFRGISSGYMRFAIESMIDEIAVAGHADPLAFRLDLLKADPRAVKVIEAVAQAANWTEKRPGRALGLAYSDDLQTYLAVIAEISLDEKSGEIRVHTIWCAVDAGIVVQPMNITAQIEGGLLFGLGPALFEQINIKNGETAESNFGEYRVLRMSDIPEIHVAVIRTDNPPTGVGEAGVLAIAPAIANAFARLSGGKRLRHLPMLPDRVKSALARTSSL